jgi:DNA-binding LacI/PurR family transcriptional regulator
MLTLTLTLTSTMKKNSPTLHDVAALAGVSHQTVSRVINAPEQVLPETRARVEDAIRQLDYHRNIIARSMVKGQTFTLACLSPNLTDYTFASIIEGAETEALKQGYFLISSSAPDETSFKLLVGELITNHRTDGVLVINPYIDNRSTLIPENTPTVFLGARPRSMAFTTVCLDDRAASQAATQYLVDLGHRSIVHITGLLQEDCSQDRRSGYEAALLKAGIKPDPAYVLEGDWSATSGYQITRRLLEDHLPFTGVIAQNDRMAIGVMRALREAGKRIPENVSVVGFDDMPLASYFDPALTTMRQDTFEMGRIAARLLIQEVERPTSTHQQVQLSAELVVRGSTSPQIINDKLSFK